MSVMIKGMEMPETCSDCRFAVNGWCYAIPADECQEQSTEYTGLNGRLYDCPLEEVDKDRPSWVHILPNDGPFSDYWICGSCGWQVPGCTKPTGFTHCPHCGKPMRELNEDFKAWEEPR